MTGESMTGRVTTTGWAWLLAGVVMAAVFWMLPGDAGAFRIALKGTSVAALAAYALASSSTREARMIAAVMVAGAAGDVALELSTVAGGAFFLLSHLIAIALYLRSRRPSPAASQRAAAAALLVGVPLSAWLLARDPQAVVYAAALGAMAGSAWLSRFSRYHVGLGALLFVASDLLIFARLGGVLDEAVTGWLVWPLYYAGQLLICTGVISAVQRDQRG